MERNRIFLVLFAEELGYFLRTYTTLIFTWNQNKRSLKFSKFGDATAVMLNTEDTVPIFRQLSVEWFKLGWY